MYSALDFLLEWFNQRVLDRVLLCTEREANLYGRADAVCFWNTKARPRLACTLLEDSDNGVTCLSFVVHHVHLVVYQEALFI